MNCTNINNTNFFYSTIDLFHISIYTLCCTIFIFVIYTIIKNFTVSSVTCTALCDVFRKRRTRKRKSAKRTRRRTAIETERNPKRTGNIGTETGQDLVDQDPDQGQGNALTTDLVGPRIGTENLVAGTESRGAGIGIQKAEIENREVGTENLGAGTVSPGAGTASLEAGTENLEAEIGNLEVGTENLGVGTENRGAGTKLKQKAKAGIENQAGIANPEATIVTLEVVNGNLLAEKENQEAEIENPGAERQIHEVDQHH